MEHVIEADERMLSTVVSSRTVDETDLILLRALVRAPESTNLALADATGLARNTIRARLARYDADGALHSFDRRIDPAFLGYPLQAFIMARVTQRRLASVFRTLAEVPEVLEVHGLSGKVDLLVHVVARDADDMYRVAGRILAIDGVKRTTTHLVMGEFVEYRVAPLLAAAGRAPRAARARGAAPSAGRVGDA